MGDRGEPCGIPTTTSLNVGSAAALSVIWIVHLDREFCTQSTGYGWKPGSVIMAARRLWRTLLKPPMKSMNRAKVNHS